MTGKSIGLQLRRNGFKLTPQRRAIIDVISGSEEHLTPSDIYSRLQHKYPGIGLVTVYRTLELLENSGLLCEVHIGDTCRSYLKRKRPGEHHHHLVCAGCGKVVDFIDCELGELENRLTKATGFAIDSHLLEFMGRCANCRKIHSK